MIEEKQIDERIVSMATGYEAEPTTDWLGDLVGVLVREIHNVAPWWSRARDIQLREYWKDGQILSEVMGIAQSKLASIPMQVVPKDKSIVSHRKQAERITTRLIINSDLGLGLHNMMLKSAEDYLGQDNGVFIEVLGAGNPSGPIVGPVAGLRHLDSAHCTRTHNPIYPVLYDGEDGKRYKMHNARVIYISQMPSPRRKMNNVGFCSISRSLRIAQNAHHVINYQDEKMGARAANQILVGSGVTGKEIIKAMAASGYMMDNLGLENMAKTVAIGSNTGEVKLDRVELSNLDPFDEGISKTWTAYAIAAAWGLEFQDLMPITSTRQSDIVSLQRSRTKLQHMFMRAFIEQVNMKVLPPYLELQMDYVDDQADQQHAVIEDITSRNFERQMAAGVTTPEVVQEILYERKYINRSQLRSMKLAQGRLENGAPVQSIFFDERYDYLFTVSTDLLVSTDNDSDEALAEIEKNEIHIYKLIGESGSGILHSMAEEALRALTWLRDKYENDFEEEVEFEEPEPEFEEDEEDEEGMAYTDGRQTNQERGEVGKATDFFTSNSMMVESLNRSRKR